MPLPLGGGMGGGMPGMPGPAASMPGMPPEAQRFPNLGGSAAPQDPKGTVEMAKVNLKIAIHLLEQAIPVFGTQSPQGKAVMSALSSLAKDFGKNEAEDLTNSQLMNMFSQMQKTQGPPGGQIPPELLKAVGGGQGAAPPQPGAGMPRPM